MNADSCNILEDKAGGEESHENWWVALWIEQKKRYITINFKTLNCESVDIS